MSISLRSKHIPGKNPGVWGGCCGFSEMATFLWVKGVKHQEEKQLPGQVGVSEQLGSSSWGQCPLSSAVPALPTATSMPGTEPSVRESGLAYPLSRGAAKCWVNQCINRDFI